MIGAIFLFVVLSAIAAVHANWARGGFWPGSDEETLVAMVVGETSFRGMPPVHLIRIAATGIFLAACTGLALGFELPGILDRVVAYAGAGFTAVFGLRGVIGFLPFWRRRHPLEPFATLDRLVYSPGCVIIGEVFFTLVSPRF